MLRHRSYLQGSVLSEARIEDIDEVEAVIDTGEHVDAYVLGNSAAYRSGKLIGWHVTDDISKVMKAIRGGTSFVKSYGQGGTYSELGPGLYVSAVPEVWAGRSVNKWDFLKRLTSQKLSKLLSALKTEIDRLRGISDSERLMAERTIKYVRSGDYDEGALVSLASQPFGIPFWKADFLSDLGIKPSEGPKIYEVKFKGKFVKLDLVRVKHSVYRLLRRAGVSGAFVSGFVADPQLVIWSPRAIVSIKRDKG